MDQKISFFKKKTELFLITVYLTQFATIQFRLEIVYWLLWLHYIHVHEMWGFELTKYVSNCNCWNWTYNWTYIISSSAWILNEPINVVNVSSMLVSMMIMNKWNISRYIHLCYHINHITEAPLGFEFQGG